jgi:hypothetical protein
MTQPIDLPKNTVHPGEELQSNDDGVTPITYYYFFFRGFGFFGFALRAPGSAIATRFSPTLLILKAPRSDAST